MLILNPNNIQNIIAVKPLTKNQRDSLLVEGSKILYALLNTLLIMLELPDKKVLMVIK